MAQLLALITWVASLASAHHEPTPVLPTPLPTATASAASTPVGQDASIPLDGDAAFIAGYQDHGGNPAWLAHFLYDVAPCEGGYSWGIADYGNGYVSRLQFHPGSWATAASHTGLWDGADPYHIGANVAWWSSAIDHPGTTSGWPHCWWVGSVP